jgi:hypothetical protein
VTRLKWQESSRPGDGNAEEIDMMISGWWLLLVFLVGAYAGITLLAALMVSSHEPAQTDADQLRDDPVLARIAAQWRGYEPVGRPNHRRTNRKRGEAPRETPQQPEKQADFQW